MISYFDIILWYHILISYFDIIFWCHIWTSYFDLIFWPYIFISYNEIIAWINPRLSMVPRTLGNPRGVWGACPPVKIGGSRGRSLPELISFSLGGLGGLPPSYFHHFWVIFQIFQDIFLYILPWYLAVSGTCVNFPESCMRA